MTIPKFGDRRRKHTPRVARPLVDRFEEKYVPEPNSGCWLWTAGCAPNGYGQIQIDHSARLTHRVSYELYVGPIPDGGCAVNYGQVTVSINGKDMGETYAEWFIDPAHGDRLRWAHRTASLTLPIKRMGSLRYLRKLADAQRFAERIARRRQPHPKRVGRFLREKERLWQTMCEPRMGDRVVTGDAGPGEISESELRALMAEFCRRALLFEPFRGIGPRRFFDLFSMNLGSGYSVKRKEEGGTARSDWTPSAGEARVPLLPASYMVRESWAAKEIARLFGRLSGD